MGAIVTLSVLWGIPAAFVLACLVGLFRAKPNWQRASLYGVIAFGLFLFFGIYSMLQERSSTAGLGILILPIIALLPGGIGFTMGKIHSAYLYRKKTRDSILVLRSGLLVCMCLITFPFIWQGYELIDTIQDNKSHDLEADRQRKAVESNTSQLKALLADNPGKEVDILRGKLLHAKDRTELIPIAESEFATPDILAELSRSQDFGVVLTVVRNRNVVADTLEWIYLQHTYPSYFYTALSSNPNTPKQILSGLYLKRHTNTGIVRGLSGNPNLPKDILIKLTKEPDRFALGKIINRSDLNCELANRVMHTIKAQENSDIGLLIDKAKKLQKRFCVTTGLQP